MLLLSIVSIARSGSDTFLKMRATRVLLDKVL